MCNQNIKLFFFSSYIHNIIFFVGALINRCLLTVKQINVKMIWLNLVWSRVQTVGLYVIIVFFLFSIFMGFFLSEKQCVYRGRRICWWNFLISINEILDVSISFLNDHLEETLGSTKIEEIHSKCINLAQVSVSS